MFKGIDWCKVGIVLSVLSLFIAMVLGLGHIITRLLEALALK